MFLVVFCPQRFDLVDEIFELDVQIFDFLIVFVAKEERAIN